MHGVGTRVAPRGAVVPHAGGRVVPHAGGAAGSVGSAVARSATNGLRGSSPAPCSLSLLRVAQRKPPARRARSRVGPICCMVRNIAADARAWHGAGVARRGRGTARAWHRLDAAAGYSQGVLPSC